MRDRILLAISQGMTLNREASIAAFFILMVLSIGMELCRNEMLPGLLGSGDYYALALQYLPVIVTLHNMENIQGEHLRVAEGIADGQVSFCSPCTPSETIADPQSGTSQVYL